MIGFLKGKLISSKPTKVLLDVNGVGYNVNISINTFEKISDKKEISLFIHTNVKEDSISLFGFFTEAEKEMFEILITVNGVGPKIALSILSGITVDELKNAILTQDVSRITAVPGIGRKTSERLVLELKNKVENIHEEGTAQIPLSIRNEASAALITLGYNSKISDKIVREILNNEPQISIEELIKKALSSLNS